MKIGIVGSRTLFVTNLTDYLPSNCTEIVSGGARGIDQCAKQAATENDLLYKEFLPDYQVYGRGAPIVRNRQIVDYSDEIIAFWDGTSRGTKTVIDYCKKANKKCTVIMISN